MAELMEDEVRRRLMEENRIAGVSPIFTEKVKVVEGFIEELLDGNADESFMRWNMLRKSRKNILSITIDRKEGVLVEQANLSRDVHRMDGQCRDLLYGSEKDCRVAWEGVDKKAVTIKVDVRQAYPSAIGGATEY